MGAPDETKEAEASQTSPGGVSENAVAVNATEYTYEMPSEIEGGVVSFEMENTGTLPHEFGFARLDEGKTVEDLEKAFEEGGPSKWAEDLAGVPLLGAGRRVTMTRELNEGTHVFFCFLPSPEGQPHIQLGMIQGFEVSGTSDAELPEPDSSIVATDDGFEIEPIEPGLQTLELRNDGKKPHEFALFSLEPGKELRDIDKWFGNSLKGESPALFPGGIQSIEPGTVIYEDIEFEAGRTYQVQDFEAGFEEEFTVSG
jgi:hypothetical protein